MEWWRDLTRSHVADLPCCSCLRGPSMTCACMTLTATRRASHYRLCARSSRCGLVLLCPVAVVYVMLGYAARSYTGRVCCGPRRWTRWLCACPSAPTSLPQSTVLTISRYTTGIRPVYALSISHDKRLCAVAGMYSRSAEYEEGPLRKGMWSCLFSPQRIHFKYMPGKGLTPDFF